MIDRTEFSRYGAPMGTHTTTATTFTTGRMPETELAMLREKVFIYTCWVRLARLWRSLGRAF